MNLIVKKILNREKVPFILSLIIGIIVFQLNTINNLISNNTKIPYLTYDFNIIEEYDIDDNTIRNIDCEIQNVSQSFSLKDINLNIEFDSDYSKTTEIYNPNIVPLSPSSQLPDEHFSSHHRKINRYNIPQINPYSKYILELTTHQKKHFKGFPKIYLATSDNIRLIEKNSCIIFFINNQLLINSIILLLLLLLISYYSFLMYRLTIKQEK